MNIETLIQSQLKNPIVLYMKGIPQFPMCGYSAKAVAILSSCGIQDYLAVDVLEDELIREGIKAYRGWPTIPQLYIRGELIGGCDIMQCLHDSGELQQLLEIGLQD